MRYMQLGNTGLEVSKLALGTWALGGDWGPDVEPGMAAMRRAFDLGVNVFDTAHGYGWTVAETRLAEALGDLLSTHRDEIVVATKGGLELRSSGMVRNSDPSFLRSNLHDSLQALGTDYVDVYFIHWPDPTVPYELVGQTLGEFIDEGLVRFAGVSNFSTDQMEQVAQGRPVDAAQLPYNLLWRDIEETELPYLRSRGIGVMAWSALFHGILTGTLRRGQTFPEGDFRANDPRFQGESLEQLADTLQGLEAFANDRGCTLPQVAIAWIAEQGILPIIGAQVPEHIELSAVAADIQLTGDDIAELARIAEEAPRIVLSDESIVGSR